jgi:serine/threonine-protein kinase
MERLHGRTLRAEMEGAGALPPARVSQILRGVCSAVDAAHRRRLVHRDLKPENVFLAMVEGTEVPKVLDFGIAKSMPALVPDEGRQTAVGMLVGTPEYMSPEQLRGEEVNPSWDLWALGVLAFEMLTGRHPFAALVAGRTAPAFPAGHAALLGEALTPFDGRWSSFFTRALSIDPAHRPPTAGAFSSELEATLPHA